MKSHLYVIKKKPSIFSWASASLNLIFISKMVIDTGANDYIVLFTFFLSALVICLFPYLKGVYKIGVSNNYERRIKEIQTGNEEKLKFWFVTEKFGGAYALETFLHRRYKKSKLEGEWFKLYFISLLFLWIILTFKGHRSII